MNGYKNSYILSAKILFNFKLQKVEILCQNLEYKNVISNLINH